MFKKRITLVIILVVMVLKIVVLFGKGYAAAPDIRLVIYPKETEVYAGTEPIVITVKASGTNLTFTWKLSGLGKLEAEGAAAFYTPPQKIDQTSEYAIVTVTVKEESGQVTIKSVTFVILPKPAKTATPSPEPTPTEKEGISKGTMVALGVGAVAALGGGIALAVGGDEGEKSWPTAPSATCAGTWVGVYCWYLGAHGESCTQVCASHGGYHEATRFYAGDQGTDSNCEAVLSALGAPANEQDYIAYVINSDEGCYVYDESPYWSNPQPLHWSRGHDPTTADAARIFIRRACACVE